MDQRQDLITCDPFCSANPKNQRGGRWTTSRLHLLALTEADYSTGKRSFDDMTANLSHLSRASVERQFYNGWKHPHKRKPQIKAIFRIISPPSFHMPYYQHRSVLIDYLSKFVCDNLLQRSRQYWLVQHRLSHVHISQWAVSIPWHQSRLLSWRKQVQHESLYTPRVPLMLHSTQLIWH